MRVVLQNKMSVEVWSDVMCPFCYIGKRHYEAALAQFAESSKVEIIWHSFQLDPNITNRGDIQENVYDYLAKRTGISYEESVKMHGRVLQMAQEAGLEFHLDKALVANSFNAHRLIQMAKTKGLGDEAEEFLWPGRLTGFLDVALSRQKVRVRIPSRLPTILLRATR